MLASERGSWSLAVIHLSKLCRATLIASSASCHCLAALTGMVAALRTRWSREDWFTLVSLPARRVVRGVSGGSGRTWGSKTTGTRVTGAESGAVTEGGRALRV